MCTDPSLLNDMYEAVEQDIYESKTDRTKFDNKTFMAIGIIETLDLIMHRWKHKGSLELKDLKGLRSHVLMDLKQELRKGVVH